MEIVIDKERQVLFVWVQESPLSDTDAAGGLDIWAECPDRPDHLTLSEVSRIKKSCIPKDSMPYSTNAKE
jgi:hypothetical protein